jgi:hypothetical protein
MVPYVRAWSQARLGRPPVVPVGLDLDPACTSIACRFHAPDAHLVMSSDEPEPISFSVLLDGAAPGASHGEDVDAAGGGLLERGRLYQLVRADDSGRDRTLEIVFAEPGARAYAFTFG